MKALFILALALLTLVTLSNATPVSRAKQVLQEARQQQLSRVNSRVRRGWGDWWSKFKEGAKKVGDWAKKAYEKTKEKVEEIKRNPKEFVQNALNKIKELGAKIKPYWEKAKPVVQTLGALHAIG